MSRRRRRPDVEVEVEVELLPSGRVRTKPVRYRLDLRFDPRRGGPPQIAESVVEIRFDKKGRIIGRPQGSSTARPAFRQ